MMSVKKWVVVSLVVLLFCSNASVAFAEGETPPPDTVTWADSTDSTGSIVDMSGLQATQVQVQVNTGSGPDAMYGGGQGRQTETVPITVYQDPNKGGYFVAMNDTAAANAYQTAILQDIVNASDGVFTTSSALQSSQTQANGWTVNQHATSAGSTSNTGYTMAYITSTTLQSQNVSVGFNQVSNSGAIYTPAGAGFDGNLQNSLAANNTGSNLYYTASFASDQSKTSYTGSWNLYNSLDVGGLKLKAGVQSLLGNQSGASIIQTQISEYQTQNNYGKNTSSLGQQILKALQPSNLINAVTNLIKTGKLDPNPTTYTQWISPGTFGNQMQVAIQTHEMQKMGATNLFLIPEGNDLLRRLGIIPGGGDPGPGGGDPNPPGFIWNPVYPPVPSCSHYAIIPGNISAVARHTAPPNPVVIGQDEQKRGADLWWELNIAPTIEEWEELVVTGYGKQCNPFNPLDCVIYEEYGCELHRNYYCERVAEAEATATLSAASTRWILEDLSYKYPGATLKNPGFGFRQPAIGACHGTTYVWTIEKERVQVEDPGNWDLGIQGVTAGTPVSGARTFRVAGGSFPAYLIDTTIIR